MKVGLIVGVFDIYHPGHVLTFTECKKHCDKLIVGINAGVNFDPIINPIKNNPIYSLDERILILKSNSNIDEIFTYSSENELIHILKKNRPDIRFLGDDYYGKDITGENLSQSIVFIDRSHGYSTTSIISRIINSKLNG